MAGNEITPPKKFKGKSGKKGGSFSFRSSPAPSSNAAPLNPNLSAFRTPEAQGGARSATLPSHTDPSAMAMYQSQSEGLFSRLKRRFRMGSKGKYDFKTYNEDLLPPPRRERRKSDEPQSVADNSSEGKDKKNVIKAQSVKTQRRAKSDKEEVILIRKDKRVSVICKPVNGEAEIIFSNVENSEEDFLGACGGTDEDPYATISSVKEEASKIALVNENTRQMGKKEDNKFYLSHSPSSSPSPKLCNRGKGSEESGLDDFDELYARIDPKSKKCTTSPSSSSVSPNTDDSNPRLEIGLRNQLEPDYETLEEVQHQRSELQATSGIASREPDAAGGPQDQDPDYESLDDVKERVKMSFPPPEISDRPREFEGGLDQDTYESCQPRGELPGLSPASVSLTTTGSGSAPDDYVELSPGQAKSKEKSRLPSDAVPSRPRPASCVHPVRGLAPLASSIDSTYLFDSKQPAHSATEQEDYIYDNPNIILRKQMARGGITSPYATLPCRRSLTLTEPPILKTPAEEELVEKLSLLLAPPLPLRNYLKEEVQGMKGQRSGPRSYNRSARHSWAPNSSATLKLEEKSKSKDSLENSHLKDLEKFNEMKESLDKLDKQYFSAKGEAGTAHDKDEYWKALQLSEPSAQAQNNLVPPESLEKDNDAKKSHFKENHREINISNHKVTDLSNHKDADAMNHQNNMSHSETMKPDCESSGNENVVTKTQTLGMSCNPVLEKEMASCLMNVQEQNTGNESTQFEKKNQASNNPVEDETAKNCGQTVANNPSKISVHLNTDEKLSLPRECERKITMPTKVQSFELKLSGSKPDDLMKESYGDQQLGAATMNQENRDVEEMQAAGGDLRGTSTQRASNHDPSSSGSLQTDPPLQENRFQRRQMQSNSASLVYNSEQPVGKGVQHNLSPETIGLNRESVPESKIEGVQVFPCPGEVSRVSGGARPKVKPLNIERRDVEKPNKKQGSRVEDRSIAVISSSAEVSERNFNKEKEDMVETGSTNNCQFGSREVLVNTGFPDDVPVVPEFIGEPALLTDQAGKKAEKPGHEKSCVENNGALSTSSVSGTCDCQVGQGSPDHQCVERGPVHWQQHLGQSPSSYSPGDGHFDPRFGWSGSTPDGMSPPWPPRASHFRLNYRTKFMDEDEDGGHDSKLALQNTGSLTLAVQRLESRPLLYSNPRLLENVISGFFKAKMSLNLYYLHDGVFKWGRLYDFSNRDRVVLEEKAKRFFHSIQARLLPLEELRFRADDMAEKQRISDERQLKIEAKMNGVQNLPTFSDVKDRLLGADHQLDPWEPDECRERRVNILWEESLRVDLIEAKKRQGKDRHRNSKSRADCEQSPAVSPLGASWMESDASTVSELGKDDASNESIESVMQSSRQHHSPSTPSQVLENFLCLSKEGLDGEDQREEESDEEDEMLALETYARIVSRSYSRLQQRTNYVDNISLCRALHGELCYMIQERRASCGPTARVVPGPDKDCRGAQCHLSWNSWHRMDTLFRKLVPHMSPRLDFQFLLRTYAEFKFFVLKDRRRNLDRKGCFLRYSGCRSCSTCCRFDEFIFLKILRDELRYFSGVIEKVEATGALFMEEKDVGDSLLQLLKLVLEHVRKMKRSLSRRNSPQESKASSLAVHSPVSASENTQDRKSKEMFYSRLGKDETEQDPVFSPSGIANSPSREDSPEAHENKKLASVSNSCADALYSEDENIGDALESAMRSIECQDSEAEMETMDPFPDSLSEPSHAPALDDPEFQLEVEHGHYSQGVDIAEQFHTDPEEHLERCSSPDELAPDVGPSTPSQSSFAQSGPPHYNSTPVVPEQVQPSVCPWSQDPCLHNNLQGWDTQQQQHRQGSMQPQFSGPVGRFHVANYANFRSDSMFSVLSRWESPLDYLKDPNILESEEASLGLNMSACGRSCEVTVADPKPLQEREDFLESMQQLQMKEWYWGPISYEQADLILKDKEDGSFLVRDSSDRKYLLSLSFKSLGAVHHTRIEHAKGLFSFWSQPESLGKARICEFIEKSVQNSRDGRFLYFMQPSARGTPPLPIRLLVPVSRHFRVASLKHLSRFVVRQTVRKDHIERLPVPEKVKGYIREKQYYVEILDDDQWAFDGDYART